MEPVHPLHPESLLEHTRWLRALARALVGDAALADDLVQDTLVAGLERRARPTGSLRAWLAGVLRNRARLARRSGARRGERERARARSEAEPSTAQLVLRLELQRTLMAAVEGLDEREREVVLLRFFEDLPPRRIAARLGISVKTVDSRLARALARLRGRLDRAHGGERRPWALALAAWPDPQPTLLTLGSGALAVKLKILVPLVIAAVLSLAYFEPWRGEREPSSAGPQPSELTRVDAPDAGRPGAAPLVPRTTREPLARAALAPKAEALAPAPLLVGRVLVLDRGPLAAARVGFVAAFPRAGDEEGPAGLTDGDGRFELADPGCDGRILCAQEGWVTVLAAGVRSHEPARELLVVVAEDCALAGIVVDPQGVPLPGARVRIEPPADLRARADGWTEHTEVQRFSAVADAAGRFRFRQRPLAEGALLEAWTEGYAMTRIGPPAAPTHDLAIELEPFDTPDGWLEGRVVDPAGAPVAGAHVALGSMAMATDAQGGFRFLLTDFEPQGELVAIRRGYLPARLQGAPRPGGGFAWPAWVELRLAGEPLTIVGRVLDERGQPAHPAWVWIGDATPFARAASWPLEIESELAGSPARWSSVQTDAEGRFELRGLLEREYAVRAIDRATLLLAELEGVPAGARDIELCMPADALHGRLLVRVVDRSGAPVEGAYVGIERRAHTVTAGGQSFVDHARSLQVRTGAQGQAELRRVPREDVELAVQAPGFFARRVEVAGLDAGEEIEVILWRSCPVHVDLGSGSLEADELALLDAAGDELLARWRVDQAYQLGTRVPLLAGRQSFNAPEAATVAVFFQAGSEVARLALELSAVELNRLVP